MTQGRRWYEINPIVADAMHAWEHFHPALQRALAIYLNTLFTKQQIRMQYRGIYNLAPKRLVTLYRNRKKQRWYDQDPLVREAMNQLILARFSELIRISYALIQLRSLLQARGITGANETQNRLLSMINQVFENPKYR